MDEQIRKRIESTHDARRHVYMTDFTYRLVLRCQENCVYGDFPSGKVYCQKLQEERYAIGRAGGQLCN